MKNFLERRLGKELDINCGNVSVTGKVIKVEGNVVYVEKDEVVCYLNIEKIVAVWDLQDKKTKFPGFVTNTK